MSDSVGGRRSPRGARGARSGRSFRSAGALSGVRSGVLSRGASARGVSFDVGSAAAFGPRRRGGRGAAASAGALSLESRYGSASAVWSCDSGASVGRARVARPRRGGRGRSVMHCMVRVNREDTMAVNRPGLRSGSALRTAIRAMSARREDVERGTDGEPGGESLRAEARPPHSVLGSRLAWWTHTWTSDGVPAPECRSDRALTHEYDIPPRLAQPCTARKALTTPSISARRPRPTSG